MEECKIKDGATPPDRITRPSITNALRALRPGQHFDVPNSRRKNLSWCVWYFKQQFPTFQFRTQTVTEDMEKIVRCWRLDDVPPGVGSYPKRLHSLHDQKRQELIALDVGMKSGVFVDLDVDNPRELASVKQFLDSLPFSYKSCTKTQRVRNKPVSGVLVWRES